MFKAGEDAVPVPEQGWQIAPGTAGAHNPQHRLDKQAIVLAAAPWITGLAQTTRFHLRPLGVRQHKAVHPSREAQPSTDEKHKSQQALEQRLARWLLMCHDRVDGGDLSTTHEFLSLMLGVRRAGVTVALQVLEDRGLIATKRAQITVLDRAKLEAVAGDSYGVPEAEYARLFGHPAAERPRIFEQAHRIEDPSGPHCC